MYTSYSPYFLPPIRFSKPFFCNFAIMNFTPSSGVDYSITIPTAIRVIAIADVDRYGLCCLTPINNL